jgi:hypothetical protein
MKKKTDCKILRTSIAFLGEKNVYKQVQNSAHGRQRFFVRKHYFCDTPVA